MNASGKASVTLVLEWAVWFALAAAGYWLTFEFDEPLDVYEFGASGWPRFILVCIVVGATVQLFLDCREGDGRPRVRRTTRRRRHRRTARPRRGRAGPSVRP